MNAASELCRSVRGLAQSADIQIALFPEFAVVGDELALAFDAALVAFRASGASATPTQLATLTELDEYLVELSGFHNRKFWCDKSALDSDVRWQHVRRLARAVLDAFDWPPLIPGRDGAVYVAADRTVRNS